MPAGYRPLYLIKPKKGTSKKFILDVCKMKNVSFHNIINEQKDNFGMGYFFCSTLTKNITTE